MKATYALLAAVVAQEATATWDFFAQPLNCPIRNNNECSDKQKAGFDWSDLKDGDSNFQYGDFDFSKGWKCGTAHGKRDALTKRTFGGKTIQNKCSKEQPASFGCNKRKDGFSITTIDVSVEFDVEVDLHYKMNDGSLCKQKSVPCKQSGNTIQNTQCGGAHSVEVYLGSSYKGEKSDCQIGLHHIGFDCTPGQPYTPPAPPAPPARSPSSPPAQPPVKSTHAVPSPPPASGSCNAGYGGPGCPPAVTSSPSPPAKGPSSSVPLSGNTSPTRPASPPTYETSKISVPSHETPSAPPAGPTPPPPAGPSSPPPAGSSPAPPSGPSPPPPAGSSPSPPAGPSAPPAPPAVSPPCNGQYGGSCGASSVATSVRQSTGVAVPSSLPPSPPSQPSSPASPPPKGGNVPPQLPQCMNTWLSIETECKDNSAAECYCKNSKFTKNVIDCVSAWCETDEQTKQALQYLVGICAQYVPQNPGLVGDCPKGTFNPPTAAPPAPAPPAPIGGGSSAAAVPSPAPTPANPAPQQPVTTIVYSSTTVTVPMVHFTTETPVAGATPTAPVGLIPGTAPPSTPAVTTGAPGAPGAPYPTPSTLRPVTVLPGTGTGTGALRPSSPAQFTGAASPLNIDAKHAFLGAALAFLAL